MKKSILLLVIGLIVLVLIGLMLFVVITYTQRDFSKNIRLHKHGVTQEQFQIDGLDLKPGENREYELKYSCVGGGLYDLTFEGDSKHLGGMEQYIVVEVESSNRKVSLPLKNLLMDGIPIELTIDLNEKLNETVYLRFIMPAEVGNEAQGTTTSFWIQMIAQHHSEEMDV